MLHYLGEILGIEITDDNAELLETLGIILPDRAARLIAPSGRAEHAPEWTAGLVKRRLPRDNQHESPYWELSRPMLKKV
jgi:hypothetical protein